MCDIEGHCGNVEDNYYGWRESDIKNMKVVRIRSGYKHELPKAKELVRR